MPSQRRSAVYAEGKLQSGWLKVFGSQQEYARFSAENMIKVKLVNTLFAGHWFSLDNIPLSSEIEPAVMNLKQESERLKESR